jgi:sulfatase modifying factor 1
LIRDRSFLVVLIAAATGVLLARGAGAVMGERAPVAAAVPGVTRAAGSASTLIDRVPVRAGEPASPAIRDDGEPEEPHSDTTDENPYEEPPSKASTFHLSVPARDGMLKLPAGHFAMGSSNSRAPANEHPVRTVSVASFWIDRTEVTVDAYRACVTAGVCARPVRASATCTYDADDPDLPVSCVHWTDAETYCGFVGKRLPSEREWEYAARGTLAVAYPWGAFGGCGNAVTLINEMSARSCAARPAKVGSHPSGASLFGVQDLSGNVEEWTADWYVELPGPGPAPRSGAAHVLRGGGWLSTPSQSRTTSRDWGSALEAGANVGFRCAKDE